jgi:hypothetical protein
VHSATGLAVSNSEWDFLLVKEPKIQAYCHFVSCRQSGFPKRKENRNVKLINFLRQFLTIRAVSEIL